MSTDAFDSVFKTVNKVFGTQIVYTYSVGGSTTMKAVFDNAFVEINGINTRKPILKNLKLDELDHTPTDGDTILIGSTTYSVMDSQPDGLGTTTLILEKA